MEAEVGAGWVTVVLGVLFKPLVVPAHSAYFAAQEPDWQLNRSCRSWAASFARGDCRSSRVHGCKSLHS